MTHHVFPPVHLDLDFLDGFLAGDGNLYVGTSHGSANACAQMSTSKLGFAAYVKHRFESMGFTCGLLTYNRPVNSGRSRPGGYLSHRVFSRCHPALTEQFHRWYAPNPRHEPLIPARKGQGNSRFTKDLPSDFHISPDSLREWYLGDGHLDHGRYPRITVFLPSMGDIDGLLSQLIFQFGNVTLQSCASARCLNINFGQGASDKFFSYIGPCPVPDYAYRWPHQEVNSA